MIVFFDFETGGLSPEKPDIQLAAVAVDAGWNEIDHYETKIQFKESDADPRALEINHYSKEAWEAAKPERQVVYEFGDFLKRYAAVEMVSKNTGNPYKVARLAGHNAASFDGPRIQAMFKRHGQFLPAHPQVMCTLQRAMWYSVETGTRFKSLKLEELCNHFGIPIDAHDALHDVRGSLAIAKAMRRSAIEGELRVVEG